jgi:pSer/pThr/pTyr-binding forkhead associated (FHA) protein
MQGEETSDGTPRRGSKDEPASFTVRIFVSGREVRSETFDRDVVTIGRDQKADLRLEDTGVSRRHAEIRRSGDVFALVDLKSVNGIQVNGKRVEDMHLLKAGDKVGIGMFELHFSADRANSLGEVASSDPEATADIEKLGASKIAVKKERSTPKVGVKKPDRVKGYVRITDDRGFGADIFIAEVFQIGRAPDCDLRIDDEAAPWKAAIIVRGFSEYRIVNVVSQPGQVLVNNHPVTDKISLADGDTIDVGGRVMTFTSKGGPYEAPD